MSPTPGPRGRQTGTPVRLHLRWTVLALLVFNIALWVLIIGAVRRVFR